MTYDCMTPDELTLWQFGPEPDNAGHFRPSKKRTPCTDCPLAFRLEEYAAGRCCLPKPQTRSDPEARRAYNAEWMRAYRARADGVQ